MSALGALAGFLAELGAAQARVEDLERAMAAQLRLEGKVAPVTRSAHRRAQSRLVRLERRLQVR